MSADSLEAALRELGIRCTVEAFDRLAVIVPDDDAASADAVRVRRDALRLLGSHGFTNMALELSPQAADHASLHRD